MATIHQVATSSLLEQQGHAPCFVRSLGSPGFSPTLEGGGRRHPIVNARKRLRLNVETLEDRVVPNAAPIAVVDSYSTAQGQSLYVPAATGLLSNDTDADIGDTLTAIYLSQPSHGWLMPGSNGNFYYGPNSGYHGKFHLSLPQVNYRQFSITH